MRIVSLLPSATEILCALGLHDSLVGRSHECDFPADVAHVPVMTRSTLHPSAADGAPLTGAQIDAAVSSQLRGGMSLYGLREEALERAMPDLILTQELCDVCALSFDAVRSVVRDLTPKWGAHHTRVVSLEPINIKGIFETILQVGDLTEKRKEAVEIVRNLQIRVDKLGEMWVTVQHKPTVAALEWLDPPFAPGHWVPEQIEFAGGQSVLGTAGAPSARITWDDVLASQPEMVVCMPCGYDLAGCVAQFEAVRDLNDWRDMPAPYLNQLICVDGSAFFSRPGPRVVDGIEILAGLLHPQRVQHPSSRAAVRVRAFALDAEPDG